MIQNKRYSVRHRVGLIVLLLLSVWCVAWGLPERDTERGAVISDGQFVYSPDEAAWDIEAALTALGSPLAAFAGDVEIYALMSSVDPRILLTILELESGLVTAPESPTRETVLASLEDVSRRLFEAFYSPSADALALSAKLDTSAASRALSIVLGSRAETEFTPTIHALFPDFDLLDEANSVEAQALPPTDLLQFPFPLGEAWQFNGTHGWSGYSDPPSSLDFSRQWPPCDMPSYDELVVAAGPGTLRKPRSYADCWLEIDHAGGWTTSYYHLTDVQRESGPITANAPLGRVGCETCVGGFATAAHVHFSLKYNGAYVSLDGVSLSGWAVHPGPGYYSTQTVLTRQDLSYHPYSSLLNDGGDCSLLGAVSLLAPPHGVQLDSTTAAFQWAAAAGEPAPSSYLIRVRTVADMEAGEGETVLSQRVTGSSVTLELPPGHAGRELFWSVQAWRLGACSPWTTPWQIRAGARPTAYPTRVFLPLILKRVASWPADPTPTVSSIPTATPSATSTPPGSPTPTATAAPIASVTPTATPTDVATQPTPTTTPSPTSTALSLFREAEDGQLAWPMVPDYDAGASGHYYVHTPAGFPAVGMCRLQFELPVDGSWQLWARGMGLDDDSDQFLVIVDTAAPLVLSMAHDQWAWSQVAALDLSAGQHTISFVTSEVLARLDAVELRHVSFLP